MTGSQPKEDPSKEVVTLGQILHKLDTEDKHLAKLLTHDATKNCTYKKGYITQEVFACKTCYFQKYGIPPEEQSTKAWIEKCRPAGICLACCLACHQDHDVVELYRKRDFRCDCGNSKFSNGCTLDNEKEYENTGNSYGQNFFGLFCRCKEEYEPKEGETMLQCVICLEWYHGQHLIPTVGEPFALEDNDLICKECLGSTVDFLRPYIPAYKWKKAPEITVEFPKPQKRDRPENGSEPLPEMKRAKKEEEVVECKYKKLANASFNPLEDVLLNKKWISELCNCKECMAKYKERKLEFLFEKEEEELHDLLEYDAEEEEEKVEDQSGNNIMDRLCQLGMRTMPIDRQHQLVDGFRKLADGFNEHFKEFVQEGKVIAKEDIENFFENLRKKDEEGK